MTDFPTASISEEMGRPPLHVVETKVGISSFARARVEALVGAGRLSAFIRDAIENELARREGGETPAARVESNPPMEGRRATPLDAPFSRNDAEEEFLRAAVELTIILRRSPAYAELTKLLGADETIAGFCLAAIEQSVAQRVAARAGRKATRLPKGTSKVAAGAGSAAKPRTQKG